MRMLRWFWSSTYLRVSTVVLIAALAIVAAQRAGNLGAEPTTAAATCQSAPALRQGAQTLPAGAEALAWYQDRIKTCPDDQRAYGQLGAAYAQRARETGDPAYYTKADAVVAEALRRDPRDQTALAVKGSLALSRHQFAEALAIGQEALEVNPNTAQLYGIVGDAQIELGQYDEALDTVQKMVDLRPDLSSYSRVSYLRELRGDLPGAIEAMSQAASAGSPAAENTAWSYVQLGNLYFNTGDLAAAEREYLRAGSLAADFVPAQAAQARVLAARGEFDQARLMYGQVLKRLPLAEYAIAAGEMELAAGDEAAARKQFDLVAAIDQLNQANGMVTDLEMALFLADHGDPQAAVARARAAYAQRPGVKGAETLAWALSQAGQHDEASKLIAEARKLGTKDAALFYHAGMIALRAGDTAGARDLLRQALALNPFFSPLQAAAARQTLASLPAN
ncbi:MAG TPA: tetratricopeptide repeat protein [Herpetosiphonaceae bacterium]